MVFPVLTCGCENWTIKKAGCWKIKKQRHLFADQSPFNEGYGFPSSHLWMWELDHKEHWALKTWCFQIVILEKTLVSPLDSKEIKPVNLKGNQPWILTGRTDAETEAPVLFVTWCKELTHWKSPWCWERLKEERAEGDRGWDGWMASPTQWTWSWAKSGRWWGIGRPGMPPSMGSQRVRHNLVTDEQ